MITTMTAPGSRIIYMYIYMYMASKKYVHYNVNLLISSGNIFQFSPGTSVSCTDKTYLHHIAEILLKVALNTIAITTNSIYLPPSPYTETIRLASDLELIKWWNIQMTRKRKYASFCNIEMPCWFTSYFIENLKLNYTLCHMILFFQI
jgi:hypothetical protein